MTNHDSLNLVQVLRKRFPLLDRLSGQFGEDLPTERIPWFFSLLLSAATRNDREACCFVLDKTEGTTALAAIFLALAQLQGEFPRLAESYARTAMIEGQHVRVKPSNTVYEYAGTWEEHPHLFRLKVLNKPDYRSFPITEVLRLEPTTRKKPTGTLTSDLGALQRSSLDELLGITTYGNGSITENVVLMYSAQARFASILERVSLGPTHSSDLARLSSFLPWGTIGPGGEIRAGDAYQMMGEPLIAVTRVPQDLADAATNCPAGTKIVLIDGLRGIAGDLQAFDDTAESQRVIVLASPSELEDLHLLRDRECRTWYMLPEEIRIGESDPGERPRRSLAGRTVRLADIRARGNVVPIDCKNVDLQGASAALERAAITIDSTEEKPEVDHLLWHMYRLLLEFSESCFGVGNEARDDLQRTCDDFLSCRRWLDPSVAEEIASAINRLRNVSNNGPIPDGKADALLNLITGSDQRFAIATRSARTAESLRTTLQDWGIDLPVMPIQGISPEDEYDAIVLPAWPSGYRFTRLTNLAAARDTVLLAYPFERRWLSSHLTREHSIMRSHRMEVAMRARVLDVDPSVLPPDPPEELSVPPTTAPAELPVRNLERRVFGRQADRPSAREGVDFRRARLVQFYGGCHSLLTEWNELPVLNELIWGNLRDGGRLPTATPSELSDGDFVLFRAGGDKDFVRLLAEDDLGVGEYERLRQIADRWRAPLRRLGDGPAKVCNSLLQLGLSRTQQTVARWMNDPGLIAPRAIEDIEVIGMASGDAALLNEITALSEAISKIRGAHIGAGSRLTQLILEEVRGHRARLDGEPVLLDLGCGRAWVVQVKTAEAGEGEHLADQVNRLLWADDAIL